MNDHALIKREPDNLPMPCESMSEIEAIGEFMARSGMFGIETVEQGKVVALSCYMEKTTPLQFKRKYHLIDGNPTMRADAMLAEFHTKCEGSHEVLVRTPDEAKIRLHDRYEIATDFSLTWEEAQLEPFVWSVKKKKNGEKVKVLKHNWKTPRARMQMLWARVVSDAVRAIAPEVVAGTYTPEEAREFSDAPVEIRDISSEVVIEANGSAVVVPPEAAEEVQDAPAEDDAEQKATEIKKQKQANAQKARDAKAAKAKEAAEKAAQEAQDEEKPADQGNEEGEPPEEAPAPATGEGAYKNLRTDHTQVDPGDGDVMPVGKFKGNAWNLFTKLQLEAVILKGHASITDAHAKAIKKAIRGKEAEEKRG